MNEATVFEIMKAVTVPGTQVELLLCVDNGEKLVLATASKMKAVKAVFTARITALGSQVGQLL